MWSVNRPKIQTGVLLPDVEGKKAVSDILRAYVDEKNKFNLDLRFRIPEGGGGGVGRAQSATPPL